MKNCEIKFLEHVQIRVDLNFSRRGDLLLHLKSPSNTTCPLTRDRFADNFQKFTNLTDWYITTLFHWGENPTGKWELKISDAYPKIPSAGSSNFLRLDVVSYFCNFSCGCFYVWFFNLWIRVVLFWTGLVGNKGIHCICITKSLF